MWYRRHMPSRAVCSAFVRAHPWLGGMVVDWNTKRICPAWRCVVFAACGFGRRALFFFQAEDGIRDLTVTGVQTCALPISVAPLRLRLWPPKQGPVGRTTRPDREGSAASRSCVLS